MPRRRVIAAREILPDPKFGSKTSFETKLAISKGIKEFYQNHDQHAKGKKGILSAQYGIGGILLQ